MALRYLALLAAHMVLGLALKYWLKVRATALLDASLGMVHPTWYDMTVSGRGLTRAVITDSEGLFGASNLPEGTYTLIAELAGFQPAYVRLADVRST
jgi:hypothetical protein